MVAAAAAASLGELRGVVATVGFVVDFLAAARGESGELSDLDEEDWLSSPLNCVRGTSALAGGRSGAALEAREAAGRPARWWGLHERGHIYMSTRPTGRITAVIANSCVCILPGSQE